MESAGYDNPAQPNDNMLNIGGDDETKDMKTLFEECNKKYKTQTINNDIKSSWIELEDIHIVVKQNQLFDWVDLEDNKGKKIFTLLLSKFINRTLSGIVLKCDNINARPTRRKYIFKQNNPFTPEENNNLVNLANLDTPAPSSTSKKNNLYISNGEDSQVNQVSHKNDNDNSSQTVIKEDVEDETTSINIKDNNEYISFDESQKGVLPIIPLQTTLSSPEKNQQKFIFPTNDNKIQAPNPFFGEPVVVDASSLVSKDKVFNPFQNTVRQKKGEKINSASTLFNVLNESSPVTTPEKKIEETKVIQSSYTNMDKCGKCNSPIDGITYTKKGTTTPLCRDCFGHKSHEGTDLKL